MTERLKARILVPGRGVTAPALVLTHPISFWGGVDARAGSINDPRHPQHGQSVVGKALFLSATIGSSSASAVLMELVHGRRAPAVIVMHEPDAILLLGLIVARELGWESPMALQLAKQNFALFIDQNAAITSDGEIAVDA